MSFADKQAGMLNVNHQLWPKMHFEIIYEKTTMALTRIFSKFWLAIDGCLVFPRTAVGLSQKLSWIVIFVSGRKLHRITPSSQILKLKME
ncbi:hypothetical protein ASF04_12610 [Duganella sp. Leaf61]|nr:hypothetical protein ASF04_12610 [Duganella sp. Leaf61]